MVDGCKTKIVGEWVKRRLASRSAVISEGLACFRGQKADDELLGVVTEVTKIGWHIRLNIMIGNLKSSQQSQAVTHNSNAISALKPAEAHG